MDRALRLDSNGAVLYAGNCGITRRFHVGRQAVACSTSVAVDLRQPDSIDRVAGKIEFDQDRGFIPDYPAFVPRFDGDELRGFVLDDAAVGKADIDLAPRHEAHVRVHAQLATDGGAQVRGPVETGRVNHALDADVAGAGHVYLDASELAMLVGLHGR